MGGVAHRLEPRFDGTKRGSTILDLTRFLRREPASLAGKDALSQHNSTRRTPPDFDFGSISGVAATAIRSSRLMHQDVTSSTNVRSMSPAETEERIGRMEPSLNWRCSTSCCDAGKAFSSEVKTVRVEKTPSDRRI